MIRVALPQHLRTLAKVDGEVEVEVDGPVTLGSVLDAVEARFPALRGAIRDHGTKQRRAFVRFFACEEDLSHEPPETPLPDAIVKGEEPFLVVGAIAYVAALHLIAPALARDARSLMWSLLRPGRDSSAPPSRTNVASG